MIKELLLNSDQKISTPSSGTTVYVDYSEEKQILEVAFHSDKIYHYYKVEQEIWKKYKEAVESGESSGQFVNFRIKPFYKYRRIK